MWLGLWFYLIYISTINICIYKNFLSSTTINLQKKGYLQQYWWFWQQIYQVLFLNLGFWVWNIYLTKWNLLRQLSSRLNMWSINGKSYIGYKQGNNYINWRGGHVSFGYISTVEENIYIISQRNDLKTNYHISVNYWYSSFLGWYT